jgi:type 1 glutamine amidotransferase
MYLSWVKLLGLIDAILSREKFEVKKIMAWLVCVLFFMALLGVLLVARYMGFILVDIDDTAPELPEHIKRPSVLVFSKVNGFYHQHAVAEVKTLLDQLAQDNGWGLVHTENGAVMNAEQLARFDVVVWNNNSGTVLSEQQQQAFNDYVLDGGGFVGLHGAGGDPWYSWKWYVNELIGAQFIGHTMDPQFQDADLLVAEPHIPMLSHLPIKWTVPQEEWYAFDTNVRDKGYTVLLVMDESSYDPNNATMATEHPIAWRHTMGRGRAFYSAIGHQAETYRIPEYQQLIENAVRWSGQLP